VSSILNSCTVLSKITIIIIIFILLSTVQEFSEHRQTKFRHCELGTWKNIILFIIISSLHLIEKGKKQNNMKTKKITIEGSVDIC
jgi:hypothetical protein